MRRIWVLLAAALLVCAAGCDAKRGLRPEAQDKLVVYASVYPMYDFAAKIAGGNAVVLQMTPDGAEPHDWEPTPADIAALEKADVFVHNGAGLEHWADAVLNALQNESLVAVDASAGVALLETGGAADPHVWLSPANAALQMRAIRDALAGADPANADAYNQNYEYYAAELEALDAAFQSTLKRLPNNKIVVAHDAFGYLCDAYGLEQVAVRGFSPDSEPDPARMASVIDYIKKAGGVRVIFYEAGASPAVADAIARETGARTMALSPLEYLTDEQRAGGADYFSVMRENLDALEQALSA